MSRSSDADGKTLPDGLKAKELKEGAEVTVTVERGDNEPVIKAIRLGKHRSGPGGRQDVGRPQAADRDDGRGQVQGRGRRPLRRRQERAAGEPPAAARKETAQDRAARRRRASPPRTARSAWSRSACPTRRRSSRCSSGSPTPTRRNRRGSRSSIVPRAARRWRVGRSEGRAWAEADRRLRRPGQPQASPGRLDQARQHRPERRPARARQEAAEGHAGRDSERQGALPEPAHRLPRQPHLRRLMRPTRLNPEPYAYESAFVGPLADPGPDQGRRRAELRRGARRGEGPAVALGAVPLGRRHHAAQERRARSGSARTWPATASIRATAAARRSPTAAEVLQDRPAREDVVREEMTGQ